MTAEETPEASPGEAPKPAPAKKQPVTVAVLRAAAKGLTYPSESDRSFKAFIWSAGDTKDAKTGQEAVVAAATADAAAVKTVPLTDFFAPMTTPQEWHSPEEKATVVKAQALVEWLRANLTDVEAFRIGEGPEIPAYVVGRDAGGNWAGLKTELVET